MLFDKFWILMISERCSSPLQIYQINCYSTHSFLYSESEADEVVNLITPTKR